MDIELGNSDDSANEMLAAFGLTFFVANALEHDIINVMILVRKANGSHPPSPQEIGALFDRFEHKTMGKLIRELKNHIEVKDALNDSLNTALTMRNWLAHHYFYDRSVEMCTEPGKKDMAIELRKMLSTFQQTQNHVQGIIKRLRDHIGITDEMLKQYHNELVIDYMDGESRGNEDE